MEAKASKHASKREHACECARASVCVRARGARLDFGMREHRLEFGIAERTTSTSAQHKFELESVGLVLGAPAGAAPSEVQ